MFSRRLAAVRARAELGRADRRADPAGARRRGRVPELAGDPRGGLPGRRAAARDRRLGRDDRARVRGRAADRRRCSSTRFGWRAVFATSFVLGLPTLLLALRHVAESRDPDPPPVDWAGVGTLSARAVRGRVRGAARQRARLDEHHRARLPGAVRGRAGGVRGGRARDARARCSTCALFRNRTFTGATAIVALLAGGPFGAFVYVTLFLLDVQDRDPVEAGLVLAPLALVSFVVSAAAGRASERVPLRGALVAGMLITAVGMLALRAGLAVDATWLALLPGPGDHRARRRTREPADDVRAPRRAAARAGRAGLRAQQHGAPDRAGDRDRRARRAAGGGPARRRRRRAGVRGRRRRAAADLGRAVAARRAGRRRARAPARPVGAAAPPD